MSSSALDITAIVRRLGQVMEQDPLAIPLVAEPWVKDGWKDGKALTALLDGLHQKAQPPTKSQLIHGIDFFYDSVARHAAAMRDRHALRWLDPQRGWQSLSYGELLTQSSRLAPAWLRKGVAPGCKLVVLGDVGPRWLLHVMTAIRLGAALCILPTSGIDYALRRMAALQPDHIICESVMLPLLRTRLPKELVAKLLWEEPVAGTNHSGSHTYPPDDPLLLSYSAVREQTTKPVAVSAKTVHLGALRDGLLFTLRPGDHIAYPFADLLTHQPILLLCTLLAGATWVHIPPEELRKNPRTLGQVPLRVLGITESLRDLLLRTPSGLLTELQLWFRNPEEPARLPAWDKLLKLAPFANIHHLNMVFDSAAGGSVLCSERSFRRIHGSVLPTLGVPFELTLTAKAGPRSLSGTGVFAPATQQPGYIVLSKTSDAYFYGGTQTPRRAGRVYASADVIALVSTIPGVEQAAVVAVPSSEVVGLWQFVLLLFCGGIPALDLHPEQHSKLRDSVEQRIRNQLGAEHLPDHIEIYSLSVRRKETPQGEVDPDWVQTQFASGLLQRKTELAAFRTLSALRAAAQRTPIGRLTASSDPGAPIEHDDKDESDA